MDLFTFAMMKKVASNGGGSVDLSDYVKKSALADYAKKTDIRAYNPFPEGWNTVANDSTKSINDLCDVIRDDDNAVGGMVFLGGILCGLSSINGLANADAVVEIISGTTKNDKVIHIIMTSGSVSPYRWEYTYWMGGAHTTNGWVTWTTA